jgi:hypothetical protein
VVGTVVVISHFWQDIVNALILLTERNALSGFVYLFIANGILSTKKIKYRRQDRIATFIGWMKIQGLMKHEAIVPVNSLCLKETPPVFQTCQAVKENLSNYYHLVTRQPAIMLSSAVFFRDPGIPAHLLFLSVEVHGFSYAAFHRLCLY